MTRGNALALLIALSPQALRAQSVAAGDSALKRGDTTAAIAAYEAAIAKDLHDAEAHYRAGVLYFSRHHAGDLVSPPRLKAEEHLKYASRFQPDSAKYLSALADVFKSAPEFTLQTQVNGLIVDAADASFKHPTAATPVMLYRAARVRWSSSSRAPTGPVGVGFYGTARGGEVLDPDKRFDETGDAGFVDSVLDRPGANDYEGLGATARHDAEDYLHRALSIRPNYVTAGGFLAVIMLDGHRWPEAIDVARRLVAAAPDSGRAWAVLGMVQARANRWGEAQATFDTALRRMTPQELTLYEDLGLLLTPVDSGDYRLLAAEAQAHRRLLYWAAAQPLWLAKLNEPRTEFYTRITYAEHKWPTQVVESRLAYRGGRSEFYYRYGPVLTSMTTYPHSRLLAILKYLGRNGSLREARTLLPSAWDNVPAVYSLDTVDVQTAQFRGEDPRKTDVAIFSFMPVGRMVRSAPHIEMELNTAVILKDSLRTDVVREPQDGRLRGGDTSQVQHRVWRLNLTPQPYLLHVEAMLPVIRHAARGETPLDVRSFAGDTLLMSDVVMAGHLAPRDSAASRWTDFFVEPSSGRLDPLQPISLLWEIYNLIPDTSGVVRYHVELRVTVKEIERHGFLAQIVGLVGDATGLSARGDDAVELGFDRQANGTPGGRKVEYITLDIQNAPNATYEVEVQVTDRITRRVVSELRHLTVTPTPLRR